MPSPSPPPASALACRPTHAPRRAPAAAHSQPPTLRVPPAAAPDLSLLEYDQIAKLRDAGILLVAATGNGGQGRAGRRCWAAARDWAGRVAAARYGCSVTTQDASCGPQGAAPPEKHSPAARVAALPCRAVHGPPRARASAGWRPPPPAPPQLQSCFPTLAALAASHLTTPACPPARLPADNADTDEGPQYPASLSADSPGLPALDNVIGGAHRGRLAGRERGRVARPSAVHTHVMREGVSANRSCCRCCRCCCCCCSCCRC